MNEILNEWMDEINRWMEWNEWMNEWMNDYIIKWINEWINEHMNQIIK